MHLFHVGVALLWGCLSVAPCLATPGTVLGLADWESKASKGDADSEREAGSARDAREEARIERTWSREWRKIAAFYVACDGHIACVPDYVRGYGRSGGLPVDDLIRETAYEMTYTDEHGRERSVPVLMPEAEAVAARWLLTDPEPGRFGYIRSGRVVEVVDEQSVVLSGVQLVDWQPVFDEYRPQFEQLEVLAVELVSGRPVIDPAEPRGHLMHESREEAERFHLSVAAARRDLRSAIQFQYAHRLAAAQRQDDRVFAQTRWRIVGLPTADAEVGDRWPRGDGGLKLVVVAIEGDGTVVAAPLAQMEDGLDELQLIEVMQARGVTKAQFHEWVTAARREHRREYLQPVLALIEANAPAPAAIADAGEEEGEGADHADPRDARPADAAVPGNSGPGPGGDDQLADEGDGPQDPGFFGVPLE